MSVKIHKQSHKKIRRFFKEGFSVSELATMYRTTTFAVERVLEEEKK